MSLPRIYADFQNADRQARLRLNSTGALEDLARQQIELHEGLRLTLYGDDLDERGEPDELTVEGVATFSEEERCWVATIDWTAIQHSSQRALRQA